MKVMDTVNKTELELTTEQLIDLVANHNRQVDLILAEALLQAREEGR